jgi:UDP:flavonoid glycosyltransferase YjiC (YdhE family)
MKIIIPTIGSRGDVQPFIALSKGLDNAGHQTVLASHPVMKTLIESHGVRFEPIGPDINLAERVATIRRQARNAAIGLMQGMRFGFEMLEKSHEDILRLCKGADLVVVPAAIAAGKNEAEKLGLPYLSVSFMPWAIPWDDPERSIFKRILYKSIDGLIQLITTRPLNRIRKRQGLAPVGKEGFTSKQLNLIPISPLVYQPNPLWEPQHQIVGYWFTDEPGTWHPPDDLLAFLGKGEAPILISLGAMSLGDKEAEESVNLFVDAIQQVRARAIIQGWEAGLEGKSLLPDIFAAESLPHSWLLPHCRGMVHHGGFGSTAACLRAGIPALVIPHIADQFYWGERVDQLGVGPKPVRRVDLETSVLVGSLAELFRNVSLRKAASQLGEKIRAEKGVENAVRLIEETFA